jgi:hypothetical protein
LKTRSAINSERPQGLETLVLLILEQQVYIDSAKATKMAAKSSTPPVLFRFIDQNLEYMAGKKHLSKHCLLAVLCL